MPPTKGTTVVFLIPRRVHPLDLVGPAQVFYEAMALGAAFRLVFAGIDSAGEILSSLGLGFSSLSSWEDLSLGCKDLLFLPGSEMDTLKEYTPERYPEFFDWLRDQDKKGVRICSVCTGVYFLGKAGLLNGIPYTSHWRYHEFFKAQFPYGQLQKHRFFVTHENRISSAGISSGIDLSLHILEADCGSRMAAEVARECVLYLRRGSGDPQLSVFMDYRNHIDDRIHQVQDHISAHLDRKLPIAELAEIACTSPRNFTRRFKKMTGITVGAYIEGLRVERALRLLDEGYSMASVTPMCGLKNESRLRALIEKHRS